MSKMIEEIQTPIVEQSHLQQTFDNKTEVPEDNTTHLTHSAIEHEVRIAEEGDEQQEMQQQLQQKKEQQKRALENQRKYEQEQREALLRQIEQLQQNLRHQQREVLLQRHHAANLRALESQAAASPGTGNLLSSSHSHQRSQQQPQQPQQVHTNSSNQSSSIKSDISEKFDLLRSNSSTMCRMSGSDLEGLADVLKSEISTFLSNLVDTIVTRFVHQRGLISKQSQTVAAAADQLNKDLMMASHILDRKSPRTKITEQSNLSNPSVSNLINSQSAAIFQAPTTPQSMGSAAAVPLYNSMGMARTGSGPFCSPESREQNVEQKEALSLVVTPKKKRQKVTDTRITPRTINRVLGQDGIAAPNTCHNFASDSNHVQNLSLQQNTFRNQMQPISNNNDNVASSSTTPSETSSPRPNPFQSQAPSMMSISLPTSVAIPNPLLHESQVFSPYSPFYHHGPHASSHLRPAAAQMHHMKMSSSPPNLSGMVDNRDSPPSPHSPSMLHTALIAAAQQRNSPDYGAQLRAAMDADDRNSECNSPDMQFDGIQPMISFLKQQIINKSDSLSSPHSSTLTPMHLRKAKLMFFWVRYPSSAVLKVYFPDIKFNKNNTAQLVKWFSNFREFYYIQMEKYARQAVTDGVQNSEDLHVGGDSELYRVLNLHYNRNNYIEVPSNFRFVVEQTLREFFRAIQGGKDNEQSWKKPIYKIISRMDDAVPEYFKSPNFLEQLE